MGTDSAGRANEEEFITWWKQTKETRFVYPYIYIYIFVIPKMSHGVLLAFKLLGRAFFVSCLLLLLRLRPDVF